MLLVCPLYIPDKVILLFFVLFLLAIFLCRYKLFSHTFIYYKTNRISE